MNLNTKISVQQYTAIAEYAHSIRHYIETTKHERSTIARYKWTIDTFADNINFRKYKIWKSRKSHKVYNFQITVDAALAMLESLQLENTVSYAQQEVINLMHQLLINKGFTNESLNFQISSYEEL
ncbi:hypothetical protein GCM10027035_47660 [Emticicia sediminis]